MMTTSPRNLLAAVSLSVLTATGLAWAAEESDHASHSHETVRITNGRLHPEVAQLGPGAALGWLNYSSRSARIQFEADVAKKLKCAQRSSFQLDGDHLVSPKVEGSQFASLCQLDPGEYSYTVALYTGDVAAASDRVLEGKIVVTE